MCKKKNQRGCLPAPISRALSLAPSLFCSLPPFANIGFKPAQNSAQRKAAAEAAASPAAETPQPQDVPPRLLDRLLRDDRPALHPRYRGKGSVYSWGDLEMLEQKRKGEGGEPRKKRGSGRCMWGKEVGLLYARTHIRSSLTRTQMLAAQDLLSVPCDAIRELGSRAAPCCEAPLFLCKVPTGINQLWSQG